MRLWCVVMHSRRVCIKSSLSVSVFGFSEFVFNSFVNPFMSNVAYVCCLAGLLRQPDANSKDSSDLHISTAKYTKCERVISKGCRLQMHHSERYWVTWFLVRFGWGQLSLLMWSIGWQNIPKDVSVTKKKCHNALLSTVNCQFIKYTKIHSCFYMHYTYGQRTRTVLLNVVQTCKLYYYYFNYRSIHHYNVFNWMLSDSYTFESQIRRVMSAR